MLKRERPLILVTNDDGYFAKGISVLVKLVQELGDVVVVAPSKEMSGKSHSITAHEPIRMKKVEQRPGFEGYALEGTPVDCVKMAFNRILEEGKCDLVVAGVNHGSNASVNTIYSGTMAAVFEGCAEGIPSIGFSLDTFKKDADFTLCEKYVTDICRDVLQNGLPQDVCLNVNFPEGEIKGMKVCHQARAYWREELVEYKDPMGRPYYWLSGVYNCTDASKEADFRAMEQGYASLVPMQVDFTAYKAIEEMKKRFEDVAKG